MAATLGTQNPFRYRGYYYDNETGLYYVSSRYYDPEIGRFINADTTDVLTATPMALTDKNLFAYCDNNPVMRADNGGEFWHIVGGAVIGGLVGAVSSIVGQAVSGNGINWAEVGVSAASGALTGAITAACPGMGALATGLIHGAVGAGTYATTELVNGRIPTLGGTLAAGITSGVLAGGSKWVSDKISTNYLNKIIKEPSKIQGQSLSKVKTATHLSSQYKAGVMQRSTSHPLGGFTATHIKSPSYGYIQYHPGTPRHFGGAAYWKVSSSFNKTIRFPY